MLSLSSPLPGQGPGTGASPVIFHPSPRCGNTPRHGKSLEGNKEDTWPAELGRLPAEGTASGSSPALQGLAASAPTDGTGQQHPCQNPGMGIPPSPTAPCPHGFAAGQKWGGKVAFLWGLDGIFFLLLPAEKRRKYLARSGVVGEVGDSGDVAVGGERSLYEALITP